MAQTIPTPGSDAVIASQPLPAGEFPGLVDALGLTQETTKLTDGFSGLEALKLSEPMTDSEKSLENPFLKLPKANQKDFADTLQRDWQLGQAGVDLDMASADFARQVLSSGQPMDYSAIQEQKRQLAKSQYFNQGDNLASRAIHGTIQMLPPMVQGQLAGTAKGVERGLQMGVVGGSGFLAGPEVGAPMMTEFAEAGYATGNLEGSFDYWSKQGRGASFSELVDAGVNQVTAANISELVGPAYAAIEYAQVGKLLDVAGGKELKGGLLRGAMRQLAKVVPEGAKVAAKTVGEVAGKAVATPIVKGAVSLAGDIFEQSAEEAAQGIVSQAGTEYGKSQQQLITKGARDGAMEVLANLNIPETSKQLLSRGFDEFASSVGPMAVLSGGAKGIGFAGKATWGGFTKIANGDIQKAADQRDAIAKAGAPQTAQALAEDVATEPSSVKPTAETVTPTAPVVAPVDEPALDAELEAAGQAPVETAQPEAPKPTVGLPGDELGARIFSSIRSRKPIAKTDLDQVGGFSLSADWKLNEETGNYEYQGPVYERKEAPQVSVAKAEAAPIEQPKVKAPKAQAVAPIEAVKPEPTQKSAEAVAPTLTPEVNLEEISYENNPEWDEATQSVKRTSGKSKVVRFADRDMVVVDVKGVKVPFYRSTGKAGKKKVKADKWYPIFGLAKDGWINKGTQEQMNAYYGSPELKAIAESLDAQLGIQTSGKPVGLKAVESSINKGLGEIGVTPVENGLPESPERIRQNIQKVVQAIQKGRTESKVEAPKVEAPKVEAPKVEAPKVEAPKVKQPALPKWEEVQKNKNQIKFLKSVFKKANAKLTKEQQVSPKIGWKRKDFYSALERMYGQLTQLEFKQPEEVAPPAPKVGEATKPTELNEAEQRRKLKLANLLKVFGNKDLNGDQVLFRDLAMAQARKVASQIATQFQNLTDPDGEIYNGLISAIATRLKKSIDQKTPVFFNEAGEAIAINEESVKKWLMKAADRAGRDTARRQSAQREINIEFGGKPAEGVVTQPEAAKEETKPEGMQVKEAAPEVKEEPRGIRAIREAAKAIREQASPEGKLVLDWVVSQLVGEDSALGKIKTYKELAAYLSKVAKRTISDKRVGLAVNDAVQKLADNLSELGIKVNTEALEMALSPEGQKAKERIASEEAKAKAARDERMAKANLSDRARNLRVGYSVKERLVDAIASASPENRARIQNEVVALAEEDLLGDTDINNRLDNIEKGLQNEKPEVGQPISRRQRRGVKQAKEGEVLGGVGEGVEGARGTTGSIATAEGQPKPGARGAEPVSPRPSGAGQQVGGKQQTTTRNVSVDVKLSENNRSPAVKTLVETATSNGVPVTIQDSPESGSPVGIDINQVEGQEVPIIRVNQNKLKEVRRTLGPKAFAEWTWRAINQEIIHFRHLKLLERLAKEEGTDYKSYLKKEAKRIVQIIKRQRGLRKRIEAIYNNGQKMDDFELAFEFTRMLVEEKMMGGLTESSYMDIAKILSSTDAEGRGFVFRFMEMVRDFMYGLTGRTAAETKFLRATADAIINEQRKVMRDLYNPTEKLPVQVNFYTPKEKVIVGSAADRKASEEEIKQDTGLNRASIPFLREYARELGIKEPMGTRKIEVRDEKTGKVSVKKLSFPVWKKSDYAKAIKEKLKELGQKPKEPTEFGAALPTDRPYWLKDDGEILDVEETALVDMNSIGSHSEAAVQYLQENEPENPFLLQWSLLDPLQKKDRQQLPVQEMFNKGWLRVIGDGFNLFFEGTPNKTQLDKLFEASIEDEVKLIHDQTGVTGKPKSKLLYEPPLEDELGAAMPRRGFSSNETRFSQSWKALPESVNGLVEVRKITSGTHDVRLYRDDMGNKFIVKRGQSQEQFENELASDNVYRILNYPVPPSRLIKDEDGRVAKIANYIEGVTLADFQKEMGEADPESVKRVFEELTDGLLIDAFLFNYDVLGEGLDNIVVAHEEVLEEDGLAYPEPLIKYTAYRIDNGGTLDTRAMGLKRDEPFFYNSLGVLSDKYPELNLTASDLVAQLSDIVLNSDAILNAIPARLRPMMAQRIQWMADQLSVLDTIPSAIGNSDEEIEQHFAKMAKEMEAIKVTRNAQGELINEKTGVPSRIYLIDSNGETTGFIPKSEFRYKLERTKAFKMWFGDWQNAPESAGTSKILDEAGEPMMMYHGTNNTSRESMYMFKDDIDKETQGLSIYRRRFSQGNLFRGTWTSSSRKFSEDWANETTADTYSEQVVIPVYVKSTNPFDPRNPDHTSKLISYLEEKYSADSGVNAFIPTRDMRVAMEFGFYDWSYFETTRPEFPSMGSDFEEMEEDSRRKEFFAKHPYPILEAIINLGFDGLWVKEKGLGYSGSLESGPKNLVQELEIIRRSDDKSTEKQTIQNLKEDVISYNNNSVWNHLSFRSDGIKSSANTGKFKADKRKKFKPYQEAKRFVNQVTRNRKTLWNEFQKGGKTFASYDSAENLVTYAYSDPDTLAKAGVEKTEMKNGVVFFGARSVEGVRSAERKPTDILGAAMPRQFGVRIKDKMQADAYERLKNLTYEPIPDSMVQEEAEAYLEKHGIRGAMDATISKSSPLEHGSRELLAQMIILKLNEQYRKTKDARVLEDLIDYTDTFLSITSEAGRALRQLSFWSKLTPEGMLMLYKKKLDETNRETRDRFNEFFAKVKRELSTLPAGALDQALKSMEGLIGKADKAAEESRKKLATSNTMTFWENFSKQIGDSLIQKSQEQLNAAEEELARAAGGEATPEGQAALAKVNNAKTINQAAQEMSRNIKQMFINLAKEQGKNIRDPRILTNEEFANKTDEEISKIQQAEGDSRQAQKFTDMLARWPKALQAWQTAADAIRAQTSANPELATMFQSFLELTLETPFTMPQLKRFLSLRGIKLEDLIREHYQEGKLANNAYSLAKQMVEEAGLGAWEEEVGSEVTTPLEPVAEGEEPKPLTKKLPSLSERLTQALALQIEKYAETESAKKLDRLIGAYADKRLEPSLKRFMKRMVQYQALGLFNNAYAWNEFQRQEGLDKVKPEVVNQILEIMGKAEKLVGFRKEEAYADALSLIAYHTNTGFWNFTKSWWYLSILSGVTTQIANIAGNAYNTMLLTVPTIGKHLIAGTVDPARSKAIFKQMTRAMSLSLQDLGYLITTGRVGTRKSDNPFFSQASTDYFEVIAKNTPYRAARITATTAAMVRRVMSGVDMMFYNFNKEVYLFDSAYNDAKKSGLTRSDAIAKALDLTFRSSEALQSAKALAEEEGYVIDAEGTVERAKQKIEQSIRIQEIIDSNVAGSEESSRVATAGQVYGEELTYNEEPKGFLGALHRSISSLTAKYGLVSVPIPFTKIVANVWNQGLDATGLGIFRSGKLAHGKLAKAFPFLKVLERLEMKGLKGSADEVQAQKDMMFARGFNALAAVGIITLLDRVLCGQHDTYGFEICVNGPGPKEPAQKELLKNRLGWKPNSLFIRTPGIDGIYLSYMLSPLAIPLAGVGLIKDNDIYNYYAKKSPKDASLALAHRLLTVPMEMNFLSGLADLFEILSPNNPETALAKGKSFLSRMGAAMVVPNFFRDVDQLLVSSIPGVLNPRTAREDVIQAAFISNTPIIRQMYGSAELDILGQPIEMTSRVASFAGKDALVDVLIQKNALPTAPKKDKLLGLVPMDDTQYAQYREYRAKQLGEDLNTPAMIEALSKMQPEMAQMYVQKYTQKASQLAKAKILQGDPEILKEARETKAKQFK